MYVTEQTRFNTALQLPNLLSCFLFTLTCQLAVFRLLSVCVLADGGGGGGGMTGACSLVWRGAVVWCVIVCGML